ncbi:hypothetical protein D3C76_1433730 [compost metagenome]
MLDGVADAQSTLVHDGEGGLARLRLVIGGAEFLDGGILAIDGDDARLGVGLDIPRAAGAEIRNLGLGNTREQQHRQGDHGLFHRVTSNSEQLIKRVMTSMCTRGTGPASSIYCILSGAQSSRRGEEVK